MLFLLQQQLFELSLLLRVRLRLLPQRWVEGLLLLQQLQQQQVVAAAAAAV